MITDKLIGVGALAIAFATMGGVIWWQNDSIGDKREEIGRLEQALEHAQAAAKTCGDSVKALSEKAEQDAIKAADEIKVAKSSAVKYKSKADKILSTPPSTPGDDCKSSSDRINGWLVDRVKQ